MRSKVLAFHRAHLWVAPMAVYFAVMLPFWVIDNDPAAPYIIACFVASAAGIWVTFAMFGKDLTATIIDRLKRRRDRGTTPPAVNAVAPGSVAVGGANHAPISTNHHEKDR